MPSPEPEVRAFSGDHPENPKILQILIQTIPVQSPSPGGGLSYASDNPQCYTVLTSRESIRKAA